MSLFIQHIVWDWNGTLLDDVEACVAAINCMLMTRSLTTIDSEGYRDLFEFPVKNYYARLGFDMSNEDWDAMAREFHRHYAREERAAPLRKGVRTALGALAESGVPMSILSASECGRLEQGLNARGIRDRFERVMGLSDLYAHSKLELGRHLMSQLGLAPERVVLVGDTAHDFEVAQALGCGCVLLTRGHQSEYRISACGCPVFRSVEEALRCILGDHRALKENCTI